ncbi:protein PLASTID MOVEMENT IMPAIRED 1-RELATED 1-like [Rutidosis leptorrhynchoides]|uniref:protein PLASTID MOVEMENT IMPAIRED 1-RELATED 1-like n=1 Tax=Rutidosis leptorrhynchoides TaxID=125765 RepID=UPI003A995254
MSRSVVKRTSDEGSGNEQLYNDINVLSKALYGDNKTRPRIVNSTASSRSVAKPQFPDTTRSKPKVSSNEDRFLKDKKSIWSWNSLKSFTHVRNKRFNCCFSLQVHSIEGLPPSFDNLTVCVKWKRRDGELTTRPATVSQGVAVFEELLTNTCWVYGSRSGPHHSAKYEAKHFLLYAFVYGDDVDLEVDLGKHRVDLTRLLPLTLEELEDEKSSGKWTTSYRLSGQAKGATMNVSFGYSVVDSRVKSPAKPSGIKRGESLPSFNRSVEDIKDLHEVLPVSKSELSESVSMLYKKLEEEEDKSLISDDHETQPDVQSEVKPLYQDPNPDPDYNNNTISDFSVLDQGIEISSKENVKQEQDESVTKEQNFDDKELLLQELELALSNVVKDESDSQEETENLKEDDDDHDDVLCSSTESGFRYEEESVKTGYIEKGKSVNLDYATESVTDDFLNMLKMEQSPFTLSSESESNSPRERLLRQFEKDSMANGSSSLFNFNIDEDDYDETGFISDPSSASMWGPVPIPIPEEEAPNKTKASILEDLETESLMREWGLRENVFQRSPPKAPVVEISREEPLELPPLGEGLGPFVQTNNGGFLRSMNPEIFKNAKSGGNLIMQVSVPVVVPAEMGSGIMDVLQCLASVGIEKLSKQASKLMPLEDISGKTIQQMAWESTPPLEALQMKESLQQESVVGQYAAGQSSVESSGRSRLKKYDLGAADQEYVSLEDLAPLAMNKIEALSMEGLRIQSGMSDTNAPSNISPQSIGEISALEGKRVNFDGSLGLEGTGGLQLVNVKNSSDAHDDDGDDMDGIMGLSVTLDEWMRLDSGEMDDGDEISDRTSKILAAHHASDLMPARRGKGKGKGSKKGGGGLLGNNFTVALMVQLRDPLRNFEPVGTPMLALVQVERVFVPPKLKIYSSIFSLWNKPEEEKEKEDDLKVETEKVVEKEKIKVEEEEEEESVLVGQFKITEVHIAGVKSEEEPSKKKKAIWGSNAKQEQAGSRWLVANGMGKKNAKHPLMKSKGGSSSSSLWSISSKGKKGSSSSVVKEEDAQPVRNPNVIIPNQTVKLLSGAGFV